MRSKTPRKLDEAMLYFDRAIPKPAAVRGIASIFPFNTYVAHVAIMSLKKGNSPILRVDCAIDCGLVVNPGVAAQHVEGRIADGLGAGLYSQVKLKERCIPRRGSATPGSSDPVRCPRPLVHLVESAEQPAEVGEPLLPSIAQALANAVSKLTGILTRSLPFRNIKFFSEVRPRMRHERMMKLAGPLTFGAMFATLAGGPLLAQQGTVPVAEESVTLNLEGDVKRFGFATDSDGPVWIVDGENQKMKGLISGGNSTAFAIPPDGLSFVIGASFWSRGTRGVRTDVLTYYDPKTLKPMGETVLPNGRMLVSAKKFALRVTGNSRFALSANMAPATSVSVTDMKSHAFVAEVPTPGCFLVIPHGPQSFSSMCTNGSLLTVELGDEGAARTMRSKPFFDPVNDPVFDSPAYSQSAGKGYFLTYGGKVHPVDFASGAPAFGEMWSVTTEAERAEKWRPGGDEPAAYHAASNRLFVLMHQGEEWSHGEAGSEVWIFDASSGKRLSREELETPAAAIALTADTQPLVYTLDGESEVITYRLEDEELSLIGTMDEIGSSTISLNVAGE